MEQHLFYGVCTALVTPFLNGSINFPMAKLLIRRQLNAGIRNIVLCGTTGEAPTLSDDEKLELIRQCKKDTGDACRVIAGTGSNNTAHAIALSQAAEKAGADALLVVSPYYNKATEEGLYAHYVAIAQNVSIPIILYNVPSRTGVDMPISVYQRLSRIEGIAGVKEASQDITKINGILNACRPGFGVWTGNDSQTVPAMALGAQGVISVTANVCPEQMYAMAQYALNGDFEAAGRLQRSLQDLNELMSCEVNPIPVKAAMECIGYDCGECRLPLCRLSGENHKKLRSYLCE